MTGRGSPNAQMLPARRPSVGRNISRVGLALVLAFGVLAVGAGYWQVIMASPFSSASDNPAVIAAARNVVRGVIRDRDGAVLATSRKDSHGEPYRVYVDDTVSPVIGYASRQFGTAGLERAYDGQLTGITRPDPLRDLLKKFDPNPYDPRPSRCPCRSRFSGPQSRASARTSAPSSCSTRGPAKCSQWPRPRRSTRTGWPTRRRRRGPSRPFEAMRATRCCPAPRRACTPPVRCSRS